MNIHSPAAGLLDSVLERNDKLHGSCANNASAIALPSDANSAAFVSERIIESCISVFLKMCKIEVALLGDGANASDQAIELSGVIAISGARSVTLAVKLSKQLAFAVAKNLIGVCPTDIDADLIDLVGELANMIAGSAKERLNQDNLILGLPAVVTGLGHKIAFSSSMQTTTIDFDSAAGRLQLELGIVPIA